MTTSHDGSIAIAIGPSIGPYDEFVPRGQVVIGRPELGRWRILDNYYNPRDPGVEMNPRELAIVGGLQVGIGFSARMMGPLPEGRGRWDADLE